MTDLKKARYNLKEARYELFYAEAKYNQLINNELKEVLKDGIENLKLTPSLIDEGWKSIKVTDKGCCDNGLRWIYCDVFLKDKSINMKSGFCKIDKNFSVFINFTLESDKGE